MGTFLPKFHKLICNDYAPDFTAGAEACTLISYGDYRAFIELGGTFFRAIQNGVGGHDISIKLDWLTNTLSLCGELVGSETTTTNANLVKSVKLTVTLAGSPTEIFYANQQFISGSPSGIWESGIPILRDNVNLVSDLITMPLEHITSGWNGDDDDHISIFATSALSNGGVDVGGGILPTSPTTPAGSPPPIRTGPTYSLIYMALEEILSEGVPVTGTINDITRTLPWHGYLNTTLPSSVTTATATEYPEPVYGSQVISFTSTAGATGLSPLENPTSGSQVVNVGGDKIGTSSTGLDGGSPAVTYSQTITIDGGATPFWLNGQTIQTYNELIDGINSEISASGIASMDGGNIKITSNSTGELSIVSIGGGTLFTSLFGFISLLPAEDGESPQELTVQYTIDYNESINGYTTIARNYTIFGWQAQTYAELAALLSTAGAPASVVGNDIVVTSDNRGSGSRISFTLTDLFQPIWGEYNLAGNPIIETNVDGHTYQVTLNVNIPQISVPLFFERDEVSTYGDLISQINLATGSCTPDFASLSNSTTIHFESIRYGSTSVVATNGGVDDLLTSVKAGTTIGAPVVGVDAIVDGGDVTTEPQLKTYDGTTWIPYPTSLHEPAYSGSPPEIIVPHPDCPNPPEA